MSDQVEISSLDLRFEGCRLKNKAAERILLVSISENGIRDPLQGVDAGGFRMLLNGFKRYRCAKRLGIEIVPYMSLGDDTGVAIIDLLRISTSKGLSILEQAKLIDELKITYQMSTKEIAGQLEKSNAWVSVRTGIVKEISSSVMKRIMNGQFPVYAYMYILRPFIRINKISREDIDDFVGVVAGKDLSIRDIELLANGYFKGSEDFRRQIRDMDISWGLKQMKQVSSGINTCTTVEMRMLKDLEITQKYMQRVACNSRSTKFKSQAFYAQANLLSGGIVRQIGPFAEVIREFHERTATA